MLQGAGGGLDQKVKRPVATKIRLSGAMAGISAHAETGHLQIDSYWAGKRPNSGRSIIPSEEPHDAISSPYLHFGI
ncbi:hypothetical protein [Sphingomonas sp. 1185]|uniref:hypothetical protein n=1 Tax=Sphingomonas sp. 1185 TaxID=3156411 RepID=UPI0033995E30